jgi:hypothetical protein
MLKKTLTVAIFALMFAGLAAAQSEETKAAQPSAPAAKPDDVDSIDHIMAAVYDVISGPAGQKRDWDRFRSLFIPDARLVPAGCRPNGDCAAHSYSAEGYIERASPYFAKEGFFENEVARKTNQYDAIAQVFSTYESRHAASEKPFERGINSFQLANDGKRWWVVTIFWEGETDKAPIPGKFLQSDK